jgi:hypothetical protein
MAGTFYGYAERNADSYTDWREVGQYATDMIDETIKVRQEKKDALDKATRDALKQISNTPIGAHASARKAALEMADIVSKNLLIQEKLMKSGKLDPKDYLIYNQNALDGIDLAFNANKAYQDNYQKIMDGVNSGDMSGLTLLNAAKAEEYGDWNNMGWQMSPEGTLMVGLKNEEEFQGKKVTVLNKITSVNALNGLLLNTIPKNRLEDQVTNWVKNLGKNQIATLKKAGYDRQGVVMTREDITKRTDLSADEKTILFQFVEAEKLKVASLLGTPTNIASILFDTKRTTDSGIDYTATDDADEAAKDPSKILRVYDQKSGNYEFQVSDKQRAEAEKFAFNRMREKYDIIEKVDVGGQLQDQTRQPSQADIDRKAKETKENEISNMLGQFWWGNDAQVDSAANYFKGFRDKDGALMFTDVDRTPDGLRVVMANGSSTTIPMKNKTQADFIRSAGPLLAGELDINAAIRRGSYQQNATFNAASKGGARTVGLPEQYKNYLTTNLNPSVVGKSEEDALEEIQKLATLGGFTAEESGMGNYITISRPAVTIGKTTLPAVSKQFSFGESNAATQQKIAASIIEFLKSNASPSTLKQSLAGQKAGGTTGGTPAASNINTSQYND